MSAERRIIGINHPDASFTVPLVSALDDKGIEAISVANIKDPSDPYIGLDALVLQAGRDSLDKDVATIVIDEPYSEETRSEWATHYLNEGASGYFPSNENPRVIAVYMKNLLLRDARSRQRQEETIIFEDLIVDKKGLSARIRTDEMRLTAKEFALLSMLTKNPGVIFNREQILEQVWGFDYLGESRTVDVHAAYLRAKLKERGSKVGIKTVRGIGYGLVKLDKNEGEEGKGSAE